MGPFVSGKEALATEALAAAKELTGQFSAMQSTCPISASRANNHSLGRSMAKQSALQWT